MLIMQIGLIKQNNNQTQKVHKKQEMSDTYMEKYIGKNIYKVSNPPGGHSSISLGWDEPITNQSTRERQIIKSNHNNRNSFTNNNKNYDNNNIMPNISNSNNNSIQPYHNQGMRIRNNQKQINRSGVDGERLGQRRIGNSNSQQLSFGNYSFVDRASMSRGGNANNILQSSQMISPKPGYSNTSPTYTNSNTIMNSNNYNNTTPFQYSLNSKPYIQFLSPNIIQPLNISSSNDSRFHLQKWQQSTRQMQEELRYYQQKNRVLKEKLYGGYGNQEGKYRGDYYSPQTKRKRVSSLGDMTEELELALHERYRYRHNDNSP